ncbi:hypothetical protein H257_11315 [Aphanomyces astaci]|uniref:Uncharacterized protein n=1 Tax=Aphanomyces astaci TaxID=112090 RepID=W4G2R7_APHAT|nr:hypothetical protein H257_11315 [Aphanomyces astaci]ETV74007.1 hypothetical protein H257_11315 [Aphanomyces astaci]|eukprot:XP_009836520.1 hypothetical protein H257_11315 [Aphanomyces astaci]
MDLALLHETVAANISAYFEIEIPHRSARDHYESMLETFKSTDRAQRLWGTGSEEEVTEQVELLQNLADRREAKDEAKKAKKEKEQKRRDAMELTGFQLCLEAEQRVAKSSISSNNTFQGHQGLVFDGMASFVPIVHYPLSLVSLRPAALSKMIFGKVGVNAVEHVQKYVAKATSSTAKHSDKVGPSIGACKTAEQDTESLDTTASGSFWGNDAWWDAKESDKGSQGIARDRRFDFVKRNLARQSVSILHREHRIVRKIDRIQELIDSYGIAKDFIGQTDEGLLSAADERFHDPTAPGYLVEVDTIRDKCFKLCKHWDVLEKIIGDRASARLLLRSSNEDDDDYSVDMLNTSTLSDNVDENIVTANKTAEYVPGSPPIATGKRKSEPDKFGFSSGKKKLNTEFVGKRSFSVGESLMQGLKAQAQSSGIFVSREVLASRAAELELRKENEDRHFMLRKREIDLKANELRHKQIIEEARLISSMSFDNADVTEYFRDGLSKIQ